MTYNISNDFIQHGYKRAIAEKVDILLNGIISVPGIFDFEGKENEIIIKSEGFIDIEGKINVSAENVIIDFHGIDRKQTARHYHYEDGKLRYFVSNNNGFYILNGNDEKRLYKIYYFNSNAKKYIINKHDLDENSITLLSKPKKVFKEEGILPDFSYNELMDVNSLKYTVSEFIFSERWISDCHDYMEGASYEYTPSLSKKIELENMKKH